MYFQSNWSHKNENTSWLPGWDMEYLSRKINSPKWKQGHVLLCNELLMELEEKKAIRLLRFEPDYQDRALIEGVCVCRGAIKWTRPANFSPRGHESQNLMEVAWLPIYLIDYLCEAKKTRKIRIFICHVSPTGKFWLSCCPHRMYQCWNVLFCNIYH